MPRTRDCPLCGGRAELAYPGHPGFQAPHVFDIHQCRQCETSFADPLVVDPAIYDLIYRNSERIPGYDRYARYRELLKSAPDPLDELCRQEDIYWAVREAIASVAGARREGVRILEIGSGYGYLTFALKRAGYDSIGIDLSEQAVGRAIRDFGSLYRAMDIDGLEKSNEGGFDIVVATELIEHVPDPIAFLRKAAKLLKPGGALIVTTPNRDLYPRRFAWHTDSPPVHLWWFSRTSLRFLALQLGASVRFVDFGGFYRRAAMKPPIASKPQTFDAHGNVCHGDSLVLKMARGAIARFPRLFSPLAKVFMLSLALGRLREQLFRDGLSLCAVFQRQPNPRLVAVADDNPDVRRNDRV